MALSREDYPIVMDRDTTMTMLEDWVMSLPRIMTRDELEYTCMIGRSSLKRRDDWEQGNLLVRYDICQLSCGHQFERGELHGGLEDPDQNSCPDCDFKLFRGWNWEDWFWSLPKADINTLTGTDRRCAMCLEDYWDALTHKEQRKLKKEPDCKTEDQIKLPCGHIFGDKCLERHLKPESQGGDGRDFCPLCRRVFFSTTTVEDEEENSGDEPDDPDDRSETLTEQFEREDHEELLWRVREQIATRDEMLSLHIIGPQNDLWDLRQSKVVPRWQKPPS